LPLEFTVVLAVVVPFWLRVAVAPLAILAGVAVPETAKVTPEVSAGSTSTSVRL